MSRVARAKRLRVWPGATRAQLAERRRAYDASHCSDWACPRCGGFIGDHGHFVPPSLGMSGFFTCEAEVLRRARELRDQEDPLDFLVPWSDLTPVERAIWERRAREVAWRHDR